MKPHPEMFLAFAATWVVLCLAGLWLFVLDKDIARKKRLLPVFVIGTGALFVIFALLITGEPRLLAFVAPVTALIVFLNLRMLKVCESCGLVLQTNVPFYRARFCSGCGAKIP